MPNIHIVTDSCARFVNPHFVQQYPITIVPNTITIGNRDYREGVDINAEEGLRLISNEVVPPTVRSPTKSDYQQVYARLAQTHDAIISIHASRELYESWQNAREAAQQVMGNCEIVVIDSQTLCAAQAMLVRVAAKASQTEATVDQVVRLVRGAVDRVYSIYYIDTLDYLLQNRIMSRPHAILGTMLGIKPFLTLEEGELVPIEKVRTRTQAIERLVEFAVEFADVEEIAILQHKPRLSEQTHQLQDRLSAEFPGRHFPYATYSPSLAALIGTDATGVVILESEVSDGA
jgi:DegV family protein with EDD domain